MSKFLCLTDLEGQPIYLTREEVRIIEWDRRGSHIEMSSGAERVVKEPPAEVFALLDEPCPSP